MQLFQEILENPSDFWDQEAMLAARSFHHSFKEFDLNFLLEIFAGIFLPTDVLYNILQSEALNIGYCVIDPADHASSREQEG